MRLPVLLTRAVPTAILGCLIGCGVPPGPARVEVYPVTGKLLVNGQPAANAMVAFHPLRTTESGGFCPVGVTDRDGTYHLTTFSTGDGAPGGEYMVTVVRPDLAIPLDECRTPLLAHDRFQGRYADPANSRWRVVITPGHNEVDLHVASGWSSPRLRDLEK